MKVTLIPIVISAIQIVLKGLGGGLNELGNQRKNRDHIDNSVAEIDQNIEKSP